MDSPHRTDPDVRPSLRRLPGRVVVCRLPPDAALPEQVWGGALGVSVSDADGATMATPDAAPLFAMARTAEETSVVVPERWEAAMLLAGARVERGFEVLAVVGAISFNVVGLLARLTATLAQAGIPVLALSTFDTDLLLVRAASVDAAVQALTAEGWKVEAAEGP